MKALKDYGHQLGLSPDEVYLQLRVGRWQADAAWVDAKDLKSEGLVIAWEALKSGIYLTYCCYEVNPRESCAEAPQLGGRDSRVGTGRGWLVFGRILPVVRWPRLARLRSQLKAKLPRIVAFWCTWMSGGGRALPQCWHRHTCKRSGPD